MPFSADAISIIAAVAAIRIGLTAWRRANLKAFQTEAAEDRRRSDDKLDAWWAETRRLSEPRSHVEGALETSRHAAAAA